MGFTIEESLDELGDAIIRGCGLLGLSIILASVVLGLLLRGGF